MAGEMRRSPIVLKDELCPFAKRNIREKHGSDDEADSDEEAESEQPADESTLPGRRRSFVRGKNGYKWSTKPAKTRGRPSKLIIHLPGPIKEALNARKPIDVWSLLFTDEMLENIVLHTNEEIQRRTDNVVPCTYNGKLDLVELKAFIGVLSFAGVRKQNKVTLDKMWSLEFGNNFYMSVMSAKRFQFIGTVLRFDDKETHNERKATDRLAPIRDLWETFISKCRGYYTPSNNVTIDEQLLGFRGNFGARAYIKSKPARYGLKIISMNDAKTHYMYNAIPYTGRVTPDRNELLPEYYARVLCEPIYHTNRTVTFDNWFTTIRICAKMRFELNTIGTIRKNKPQIPSSYVRPAPIGLARYAYNRNENITLVSFCPKKNRVDLLVSTLHNNGVTGESGKPEIIEYYNKTKGGVDTFDQMITLRSCARKTNRWPMRFFFGMLDQAGVNSAILYNFLQHHDGLSRSDFLNALCIALVWQHLQRRATLSGLHKHVKSNILCILDKRNEPVENSDRMPKRKRCHFCPTKTVRKTFFCCYKCKEPVCDDHRLTCCPECS
ncbi:PREDICTED: piggyBac transposable element-derived protein 4-like [Vollenhovia emeryi]|uniref:piggyBac transposable element-derived protein 4-like n=1 Tax=Vollenhovia emeryi TaxID=411798 RepID=UPI0005F4E6BF|nr:PREDICTED: piggyBac transposable element-derived protein 4-like [Vollenhovia emeryi]